MSGAPAPLGTTGAPIAPGPVDRPMDGVNVAQFPSALSTAVREVKARELSFIPASRLLSLLDCVQRVEKRGTPGLFVEAGVALGGSAALLALAMGPTRRLALFDVFDMIPPPGEADGAAAGRTYDAFVADLDAPSNFYTRAIARRDMKGDVARAIAGIAGEDALARIRLIDGPVETTMRIEEPVAFAHVDLDWRDPVATALERLTPRLAVGGVLVVDDFTHWPGCREAAEAHFALCAADYHFNAMRGHLIVERLR